MEKNKLGTLYNNLKAAHANLLTSSSVAKQAAQRQVSESLNIVEEHFYGLTNSKIPENKKP